ncbi:MAG: hypothetical protein QW727_00400 [Candidatus Pacearchaeota archaeon]
MARSLVKKKERINKIKKIPNNYLIEILREISTSVGGKNGGQLIDILYHSNHINEFIIAKKLGLTINQTRNILYKLADDGLVSSVRKKDKKKGWYTYFWTFNIDKALLLLKKIIERDIEQLEYQIKSRNSKRFYICKTCNIEVGEENALINDFTCPECGEIYELNEGKDKITELTASINKLKKKLLLIDEEIKIAESKKIKNVVGEKIKVKKNKVGQISKKIKKLPKIKANIKKKVKKITKVKKKRKL